MKTTANNNRKLLVQTALALWVGCAAVTAATVCYTINAALSCYLSTPAPSQYTNGNYLCTENNDGVNLVNSSTEITNAGGSGSFLYATNSCTVGYICRLINDPYGTNNYSTNLTYKLNPAQNWSQSGCIVGGGSGN